MLSTFHTIHGRIIPASEVKHVGGVIFAAEMNDDERKSEGTGSCYGEPWVYQISDDPSGRRAALRAVVPYLDAGYRRAIHQFLADEPR